MVKELTMGDNTGIWGNYFFNTTVYGCVLLYGLKLCTYELFEAK